MSGCVLVDVCLFHCHYFHLFFIFVLRLIFRTLANYLLWRVSGGSVSYLNQAARKLQLKYSSVLTGTTERKPRWEECTELVSGR